MPYEWKENLACLATYKMLAGAANLDQFAESEYPFATAKNITMYNLRFYPKTTNNPDIIEVLSYEIARKFFKLLHEQYAIKLEDQISSQQVITDIANIFANPGKMIVDLAETVDGLIKFEDEEA